MSTCANCHRPLAWHEQGPDGSRICPRTTYIEKPPGRKPGTADGDMRFDSKKTEKPR